MAKESWIVCAEWVDSSPTFHGPFAYSEEAEHWACEHLPRPGEGGCVDWSVGLLTPPEVR